ncbi:MAG TPA: tryptophan synthase subunit alpha [Pseudomonadales bacterium]|nr:tryptophan synthase subunit alpha [Pseudomonadales bacterium]
MSRIAKCLEQLKVNQKKALIPYIVAGDPDRATTLATLRAMVEAGADILEIGVPFSDPMAEGPVIQKGHERALLSGMSLTQTLDLVREFRSTDNNTPVVLMGYANPVERMGYGVFADAAVAAGVDGLLTVDMPPEEAGELNAELKRVGIDNIFLLAPTTTDARAKHICELATGYLYYVSLKGVTGAGNLDTAEVREKLAHFRSYTSLPLCVGFGIKDAESARAISANADGVVVGSVLVDRMAAEGSESAAGVASIIADIRKAI